MHYGDLWVCEGNSMIHSGFILNIDSHKTRKTTERFFHNLGVEAAVFLGFGAGVFLHGDHHGLENRAGIEPAPQDLKGLCSTSELPVHATRRILGMSTSVFSASLR